MKSVQRIGVLTAGVGFDKISNNLIFARNGRSRRHSSPKRGAQGSGAFHGGRALGGIL
jgi:hypothetical protein